MLLEIYAWAELSNSVFVMKTSSPLLGPANAGVWEDEDVVLLPLAGLLHHVFPGGKERLGTWQWVKPTGFLNMRTVIGYIIFLEFSMKDSNK